MLKNIYIQNEARKGFKGWTKEGLDFLLSLSNRNKRLRYKIKKQIEKYIKNEKIQSNPNMGQAIKIGYFFA